MTQPPQGKPLPEITALTKPFWRGAKDGKLMMQRCSRCATMNFFPKPWCVECGHRGLEWIEVKPRGVLYSYTVSYAVMMNYPAWKDDLPVVLGIIDLDDGGRLYGQVTGCAPEALRIGMPLQAYFEPVSEEAGIPKFRPV